MSLQTLCLLQTCAPLAEMHSAMPLHMRNAKIEVEDLVYGNITNPCLVYGHNRTFLFLEDSSPPDFSATSSSATDWAETLPEPIKHGFKVSEKET